MGSRGTVLRAINTHVQQASHVCGIIDNILVGVLRHIDFRTPKHVKCLSDRDTPFDIGIIGAPFDTAVTYRPGLYPFATADVVFKRP